MRTSRRRLLQDVGTYGAAYWAGSLLPWLPDEKVYAAQLAADPLRPQFHLLPPRNWMNDPNGPIYWNGQYHLFYQFNPGAAVWGDMHWAHAVSPDMIHWKHLPIALAPTPGGPDQDGCFSGSAVRDGDNATFLYTGVKAVAPADATLRDGTHNFVETQCLATSRDPLLKTWDKLPFPVLLPPRDPKLTGFRDPCLWREGNTWYMGIGSGQRGEGGQILLYRSADLRKWEYLHPLISGKGNGKQTSDFVDSGEMWECPDFFALGKKHVLLYSTERKVFWQTGELDRTELVFHAEQKGYLDAGAFYAPKSQLDENGRRILWGWIPETRPEAEFSAAGWAGCMSLPRVLALDSQNKLAMNFLPELSKLEQESASFTEKGSWRAEALQKLALPTSAACEISFGPKKFTLTFSSGSDSWLTLSFDPAKTGQELQIGKQSASCPGTADPSHQMKLFIDASVVECIADASIALTTRNYPQAKGPLRMLIDDHDQGAINSLRIASVKPISPDRLTS